MGLLILAYQWEITLAPFNTAGIPLFLNGCIPRVLGAWAALSPAGDVVGRSVAAGVNSQGPHPQWAAAARSLPVFVEPLVGRQGGGGIMSLQKGDNVRQGHTPWHKVS